jgi:hypothetical protein
MVELVNLRQRDLQGRARMKDDIAAISFERDKYRSFMEQSQRALEESQKRLGRTENELIELRNRVKK